MAGGKLNLGTLAYLLDLDADPFEKGLKNSESRAQKTGDSMTKGLTLPLVGVGIAAGKLSLDFEKTFSQMEGLAGVAADEVDGLKDSVLGLAGETGKAPQELAEALYFVRSAGIAGQDALDALEYSAKGAAAGLGSTVEVADAITSAMNAYGPSVMSAAEATDVLVATAREGKAEPAELAAQFGRLLPVAAELGISFNDVGAGLAFLSRTSGDAALSATGLSGVMLKLLKPSLQGAEALEGVGLAGDGVRQLLGEHGLAGTMKILRERLGDSGFKLLFDDAQALTAALAMTGAQGEDYIDIASRMQDVTGATDEAFSKWADTAGFKNSQAFAQMQAALIQIGDVLVPIAADIAQFATKLLEAFNSLPGPMQKALIAFGGFLAVSGPLISVGSRTKTAFDGIHKALTMIAPKAMEAGGALSKLGPILGTGAFVAGTVAVGYMAGELTKARVNANELATALGTLKEADRAQAEELIRGLDAFGQFDDAVMQAAESNMVGAQRMLDFAESAGVSKEKIAELRGALEEEAKQQVQAKVDTEGHNDALNTGAEAAEGTADAIAGLVDAIDVLMGRYFSVEEANDDFYADLNELSGKLVELRGKGLDYSNALTSMSTTAIEFREHMRGMTIEGGNVIQKMIEQGASTDAVSAKVAELSAAFRRQAEAAGVPGPVVEHYLAILAEIPQKKNTTIDADSEPARRSWRRFYDDVRDKRVTVTVDAKKGGGWGGPSMGWGQSRGGFAGSGTPMAGPGGTDTIPTWLTPGEFVLPRNVVNRIGPAALNALLAGAGAGMPVAVGGGGGQGGGITYITVPLTVNGKLTMPELNELRTIVRQAIVEGERRSTKLPLRGR